MKLLEVNNLNIYYKNKGIKNTIVDNFSFSISEGEIIALVGKSGSGKTSIAKAIIGLNKYYTGEINYNISKNDIQYIFQDPYSSLNPFMNISYIISEGLSFSSGEKRDEEIIKVINTDIASFINTNGEEAFRNIESEVVERLSKLNNLVIATGGGSVLKNKNVNFLKQNGRLYFLDRDLENLIVTSSRPLSSTKEALEKRYKERYPLYYSVCDVKVDGNKDIEEVVNYIIQEKKLWNY